MMNPQIPPETVCIVTDLVVLETNIISFCKLKTEITELEVNKIVFFIFNLIRTTAFRYFLIVVDILALIFTILVIKDYIEER